MNVGMYKYKDKKSKAYIKRNIKIKGVIYFLEVHYILDGLIYKVYKIGSSSNIERRINELKNEYGLNGYKIIHTITSNDCFGVENLFHTIFYKKCFNRYLNGDNLFTVLKGSFSKNIKINKLEWFSLDEKDLVFIKSYDTIDMDNQTFQTVIKKIYSDCYYKSKLERRSIITPIDALLKYLEDTKTMIRNNTEFIYFLKNTNVEYKENNNFAKIIDYHDRIFNQNKNKIATDFIVKQKPIIKSISSKSISTKQKEDLWTNYIL